MWKVVLCPIKDVAINSLCLSLCLWQTHYTYLDEIYHGLGTLGDWGEHLADVCLTKDGWLNFINICEIHDSRSTWGIRSSGNIFCPIHDWQHVVINIWHWLFSLWLSRFIYLHEIHRLTLGYIEAIYFVWSKMVDFLLLIVCIWNCAVVSPLRISFYHFKAIR